MTQISYNAWSKYDLALMFTLLTLIDSRLAELETDNARIGELRTLLHQSVLRYDVAYKQSMKSFLTETIGKKDTARDKVTKVIEWVARYWMELPDEEDALRGRRIYQPFKDFDYRRDEAMMAQNGKWQNIAQVFAQADRLADLQAMGLAALVGKANTLTAEIQQLMQQRQTDSASYQKGEMAAARQEAEQLLAQVIQYLNALLVVSPDQAVEQTAQYIQQDLNKVEQQYQQGRKHKKGDDEGDVTPVEPETTA
ncbi:MAG: hypothetical protein IJ533_00710 [Prevotella sp.]|nr:hypothetical protein [Prevotella sp.]